MIDLQIYVIDDIGDGFNICIYVNDNLYYQEERMPYPFFVRYKDDCWVDFFNDYIDVHNLNPDDIGHINVARMCVNFHMDKKPKKHFSEYPKEDVKLHWPILDYPSFNAYKASYFSESKNRKEYVLINRYGKYLSIDGKFYKNFKKAYVDNYYNLEYAMEHIRKYNKKKQGYDAYEAGIKPYDRMKYLEETYRSQSEEYFINVFNKCCKYKYLWWKGKKTNG